MKTELLLGQGCGNLYNNPLVGQTWREKFNFNVAPTGSMREYAEGWANHDRDIWGHSLGGLTAVAVLARAKRVQRAVLLCPAPLPGQFFPMYIQIAMIKFAMQHPREFAKMVLGQNFSPSDENWREMVLHGLSPEEVDISMQYRTPWHGYHVQQAIKTAYAGLVGLSGFNIDSLADKEIICVGCELDQMIRPAVTQGIAHKLGARHILVPDAGHMIMLGSKSDSYLKFLHDQGVL